MKRFTALAAAAVVSGPAVALACSPDWSLARHSPTATSTVPANAIFQIVGPLTSPLSIEVGEVGQPLTSVTPSEITDQSLWSLSDIMQFSLPQVSPGASVRVVIKDNLNPDLDLVLTPSGADDTTPPRFSAPPTLGYDFHPGLGGGNCIGSDHFYAYINLPAASDDVEVANYTLVETTSGAPVPLSSVYVIPGQDPSLRGYLPATPGRRCFAVIARDLAGNEATSAEACEDFVIQAPDAGVLDSGSSAGPDGGTAVPDAGTTPTGEDSGCTCTPVEDAAAPTGLMMLGLLALRRRRR